MVSGAHIRSSVQGLEGTWHNSLEAFGGLNYIPKMLLKSVRGQCGDKEERKTAGGMRSGLRRRPWDIVYEKAQSNTIYLDQALQLRCSAPSNSICGV